MLFCCLLLSIECCLWYLQYMRLRPLKAILQDKNMWSIILSSHHFLNKVPNPNPNKPQIPLTQNLYQLHQHFHRSSMAFMPWFRIRTCQSMHHWVRGVVNYLWGFDQEKNPRMTLHGSCCKVVQCIILYDYMCIYYIHICLFTST